MTVASLPSKWFHPLIRTPENGHGFGDDGPNHRAGAVGSFSISALLDSADSPVLLDISRKLTLPAALQSAPLGFLSALFLVELRFSQQHTQGFK